MLEAATEQVLALVRPVDSCSTRDGLIEERKNRRKAKSSMNSMADRSGLAPNDSPESVSASALFLSKQSQCHYLDLNLSLSTISFLIATNTASMQSHMHPYPLTSWRCYRNNRRQQRTLFKLNLPPHRPVMVLFRLFVASLRPL